ncbi:polycystin-1-like protein 1 [Centruroides vittatus]|uniref:polycystin-1-like protein 1 n=1 Tax=Centruroides vittatus TaxID=120091 RepID=UPI00350FE5F0
MGRSLSYLLCLVSCLHTCSGDSWLIGCRYGNWNTETSLALTRKGCLNHCLETGSRWAGWREPKECRCRRTVEEEELTEPEVDLECSQSGGARCNDDPLAGKAWSVYLVDGPKLGPAILEIRPGPTYAGEGLTVKVQLELTGSEKDLASEGVRLRLFVTWEMDERCSAREIVEVTEKGLSGLAWTVKMTSPGTYAIGVVVDAGEGVVSARRRVTVSPPIPSGLKVTLHPEVKETPTCVPSHLPPGHVTVYTGRKVRLVASVETGCDPTFSWRVDEAAPWESGPVPGGYGLSLRRSVLEHTFGREGVHRVSVNVSNLHGWVHRSISVVAVDYRMSDAVLRSRNGHRHPTDSRVTFLLTVFTTHHVATHLLLRPGDGTQLRHTLQVGADDRDVSVRHDRRCRLSAEIHHTYNEEGEFHPLALVDDGTVRIEARTARALKVCHRLDHGTLSGKGVIPTGSSLKLALHLNTRSLCDIGVDWRLLESNRTVLFSKNRKIEWSPRIRRAGTYTVESTAKNPVGNVTFRHEVKVQDPVRRLSIRGIGSYYPTGVPFRLVAVIGGGSHVTCGWSTGSHSDWHKWEGHGGCRAIWTFYKAGNKRIELEAGNLVGRKKTGGRITMVEPIHGVYVSLDDPASSKRPLRVEVLVLKGSHLNVTFDGGVVARVGRGRFLLTGSEPSPGRHVLDLALSNPVGEHRTRVEMRTRSPLSEDLRPAILLQSAYRDSATYRVDIPGSSTEKLLYRWKAPCCQPLYTSLPIVDWKWTRHVQLTVVNAISSVTVEASIPEPETRIPTLLHSSVVEVGRPINFSLQNLEPDPYRRIDVTYTGDGWTDERTLSPTAGPESWTHIFHRAGWVDIRVTPFSDRLWISNFTLTSRLNVQYPLGEIHVLGPRLVPYLDRFAILGCWRAAISPESDIGVVYAWKVEDEWKITAESEVSLSLARPGSHVIEVKAWNGVSRLATLLTVIAVPVVTEVSLRVLPVHVGSVSEFRISYVGSSSCNVSVSFGDGSWRTIYYYRSDRSQPGLFTLPVLHKYGRKGDYPVVVNVSNQISWMTTRRMAHVGELISGVVLTLLTPSPVPLTVDVGLVVVRATVASGTDLKFKWEFRDNDGDKYTSVESNETVSVARHGYGIAETYNVSIEVSNPFGKVIAYLDAPVRVVEPIRQLRLRPVGDVWAAPLLVGGSEPPVTPPVTFEAQVYWGSDVEFLFDFGDGNGTSVPAQLGTLSLRPTAQCTHYYRREKAYTVKVTASNPLGSVSTTLPDLFYVQIPPKGLELSRKYYITVLGEPVALGATVTAGTNVSYDWYLGDNIVYSKRGPEIVLNFDKIGKYNVTVRAYNKVTNLSPNIDHLFASTNVYVQEPLQGVEICIMIKEEIICEGNNVSLPSDEEVTMVAHVLPSDETALKFLWDLGLGELRKTNSPSLRYNYREPGIYVANITALNHVSMVLSGQIVIHVVQKVGNLTSIRHSGSILVNRTTVFHAQYWFGTNLTFEWDFGDGTIKLITSSDKVQHTYTSVGEYWMTVFAHNKYSRASLKTNVFVLYQFCQKPQIKFIDQTIEKKIQYSHDVMLEVDLTTSCELSNDVLYFWKVFDERRKEMNFSEEITTQRQLIIPKESLPIGKYIIELKVQMNRTMVYAIETTEITIVPSNIIALWEGGILRQVGFEDDITLNIISNVNLEETNCSLNWFCTSFPFNHQQCFKNGSSSGTITRSFPSINFHVGLLNLKLSAVSFKLNIYHDRKLQASTLQELEITEKSHMLPILIKRYNHFSHVVRQDTRLIFLAICKGCRDVKLEFRWKLWLVQDGNHNLYISEHNCVQADGSTFFIHADNVTTAKPMNPTGHWTLEPTNSNEDNLEEEFPPFPKFPGLPEVKKWQLFAENTDRKKRETFWQTGDDFEEKDEVTNPPFFPFPPVEGDVTYEANHLHLPEEFAAQELISDSFYPFEEGNPGEGGSAFAREHNLQQLEKSEEKILEEIGKGRYGMTKNNEDNDYNGEFHLSEDVGHAAVDGRYPGTAPHVIRRPRIPLSSESNLVSPEYFILEPRSLKIGSTYIVEATVTSKDNPELVGKAMDYVIVNIGPTNGRCTLIPLEGREFATWFRLHCMEWKTEYHPLWYELHYTQIPNATGHLVYVGLNGNAKFTLPAGLPEYSHNVYVDVVVRDGSGSGTRVCSIVRKVYPEWEDTEDLKLFIINETTSSQSSFNKMLGEKNYQGLLHQIHVWVTGLNRVDANFTKRKRRATDRDNLRQELINLIGSLKLNTLAEAHQALQALLPLLDAPSQILVKDLSTSFELIQKFNERKSLHVNFPVKTFQESLLRVTSQIIYLSSILLEDAELAKDVTLKSLLEKSIIIMRNAIKKSASSLIPNDRPYVFETSHAVFFYSRIATDNPEPIIKFGENEIILGRQMYLDLFNISDRDNLLSCRKSYPFICDCVEIMAESFANGLYVSGNNWINTGISSAWHGGISSVSFHSCDVQDHVHVTNPNVEFHLKRLKMNLGKEYTLSKDNIHIHQLNLTKDQVNKSLIISLDIRDLEKKHLFPLCLLFSSKQPPQPTKYMKKVSSKHHEKTTKLFIPNHLVKEPGLYYLTVLDGHFSKHSRQNVDFSPVTYTLQTWLEQCVSWDGHRQHWSSDGCIVLETTNVDSVHCSCKSIGPTSYYTWNLATNLEIASVDKFLSSMIHLLPVIFIIFTYVLILIICHFYGAHDRKRAPLIDLKDNSHKYGYLMIIETGFYWNAGTTAMVCVVLHGENGMSETTSLVNRDSNRPLFRRGSINTFYISTQSNLGNLWKLQIWHNNGGSSPSWFLKNITVFDMHTGKSYYFECEQWLSVEEEDGQIEKELPLNETSWNLSKVYRETFIRYLCDYHLWSSVCLKPPYSSFSRAQRLTCCFSLIVSSAALIAVWYKYQHFQYYVEYGLPDSSWQTLVVGIISGLFVMVPHQFISALFRNSQASQTTLFKYFRPICSDWSWKSLYCSYQQKEANSTEASSESFSTSNSRSIYTADSLSHFEESLDSDDDSSREQFLLMDGNNADLYNPYNKNQYRRHSWDSYDDIGNSIEEELYNSYKKREYQSEANERIKSARRKEMNCSEQTSSGFEDWPDKTAEDANYEEFYHPGTIPLPLLSRMQKIVLPCWVQTVAWIFLLTIASFSTYITMSYVYRFGDHYFNCWLQSLFYNILASVFLLHPLWVLLLSIPVSIRTWLLGDKESFISLRVNVSLIEEIIRVDYQLKNSPEYFGGEEEKLMKRQRARYLRYLRPPPEQTLIEARRKALETKFVLKSIKSICLSLMTIVLLIVIAFGNDTNHYYRQNVSIQNAFLRASKSSFFNIRSHSAWWKWIQNDFLDGFYGVENSNGVLQQRTEFDSLLSTGCIPVGTVSIRQHRVTSQPCLELYHYFSSEKCFPNYSKHYEYVGSNKTLDFDNPRTDKSTQGRHGQYVGDGEAIILGKTSRKAAVDELERLQSKNWVNNSSRALIVEFLLYNPTLSLYIPVSILTEFTAAGSVDGSFSALPCRLYRYSTKADSVILASQFIFLILILWMVKEEVWKMWKIGHSYWLSPWKYLQASFCLLSLSYLFCHVYRSVLVTAAIQNQQFPHFVSHISEVAYWDQILNGQLGVLIFIYALSRLKLLNISVKTKQFLQVFKFIQKETLMAVLLSALLLMGFAHVGNLAFGSYEFDFKTPVFRAWRALRSTLRQSPVTRYPDSASYGAEVYAVVLLFGMLGWLALGMALIKAVMMRSKRQIRPKREKGLEAGEAARLILRSLGMAKKERKDCQCREKSSPPAELLLMELETLVDDIFVYANKLFSDIETYDDYTQLEEKLPEEAENSTECHQVVAELHHCSTENSLDKDEDQRCGYRSTNGSDNETIDSCQ